MHNKKFLVQPGECPDVGYDCYDYVGKCLWSYTGPPDYRMDFQGCCNEATGECFSGKNLKNYIDFLDPLHDCIDFGADCMWNDYQPPYHGTCGVGENGYPTCCTELEQEQVCFWGDGGIHTLLKGGKSRKGHQKVYQPHHKKISEQAMINRKKQRQEAGQHRAAKPNPPKVLAKKN